MANTMQLVAVVLSLLWTFPHFSSGFHSSSLGNNNNIIPKDLGESMQYECASSLGNNNNNNIPKGLGESTQYECTSTESRRSFLATWIAAATAGSIVGMPQNAHAAVPTGAGDGNLVDLPPEAVRSYLQYRGPLQTSADFYLFDLQDLLKDPSEWGLVGELFQVNNNRGQGNPNRIEREFTNTMRILGLSMPPNTAEEMRDAQFKFERAMAKISKATAGIRRDLPVEIDTSTVVSAAQGWDEGRVALNEFFASLNAVTGLQEMKPVPAAGPNQFEQYGRSQRRYVELKKKIKLCQNRGGPTLSQAWGQLMVSGYLQDSCGIPDLDDYFYQ